MGFSDSKELPHFVLFGDSLTQWSFDEKTEGFGWYLEKWYKDKVEIENEGMPFRASQSQCGTQTRSHMARKEWT